MVTFAFPQPMTVGPCGILRPDEYGLGGMTLRQWYAGQALAGVVNSEKGIEAAAVEAFAYADAMIAFERDVPRVVDVEGT